MSVRCPDQPLNSVRLAIRCDERRFRAGDDAFLLLALPHRFLVLGLAPLPLKFAEPVALDR